MKSPKTKFFAFLLVLFLSAAFPFFAQASFLDIIRALVTINPLELDVTAPAEAQINRVFKVEAVATNKGKDTILNAEAEIFLPSGLALLKNEPTQKMGVIRGMKEKKVSWSVKGEGIENVVNYIISVVVSGELRGDIVSADGTTTITLKKKSPPPGRPFNIFQGFFDFLQGLFRI